MKRRADERLASLVDPAISTLSRALRREKVDAVSIAAARDVLDRVGPPRGKQHVVQDEMNRVAEILSQRIAGARERVAAMREDGQPDDKTEN